MLQKVGDSVYIACDRCEKRCDESRTYAPGSGVWERTEAESRAKERSWLKTMDGNVLRFSCPACQIACSDALLQSIENWRDLLEQEREAYANLAKNAKLSQRIAEYLGGLLDNHQPWRFRIERFCPEPGQADKLEVRFDGPGPEGIEIVKIEDLLDRGGKGPYDHGRRVRQDRIDRNRVEQAERDQQAAASKERQERQLLLVLIGKYPDMLVKTDPFNGLIAGDT